MLIHGVVLMVVAVSSSAAFFVNINRLGSDLEKRYNLGFLKDYLKFPVYINPHPLCALEDEACTLDTNCCGGMECKMTVDREGVRYTCQGRVEGGGGEPGVEEEWNQEWEKSEDSNSLLEEIYRTRLERLEQEERRLIDDQYYMIKELQKPLPFDEMRDLQRIKEIEDYKRENELRDLRKWTKNKKAEEANKRETESKLRDLAKERVSKVLKEEEQQKTKIIKEIQEEMIKKKSWF